MSNSPVLEGAGLLATKCDDDWNHITTPTSPSPATKKMPSATLAAFRHDAPNVERVAFPGKPTLRHVIEQARNDAGLRLNDFTVLQNDPYRLDTPAGHRDAQWLVPLFESFYGARRAHLRGLHYAIVAAGNIRKPNGGIYVNTFSDWKWLCNDAAKAARWLGYIDFERLIDQKNAAPIIYPHRVERPFSWISTGVDVDLPTYDGLKPWPRVSGFIPRQGYRFAIFGEKSSLEEITKPIAAEYEADLYLASGEISDTLVYSMAKNGAEDGRSLVVFALSDCDPSGRQMPISIARKLQAFRDLFFHGLRFEVVPVALTPEQVRELDLPETPLKESEKRASRWREAFGVDQTEIDALTTPARAPLLQEIIRRAFEPYYDPTLRRRVREAEEAWRGAAQETLDEYLDDERVVELHAGITTRIEDLRAQIREADNELRAMTRVVALPPIEVPVPEVEPGPDRPALVSFGDDWATATFKLIRQKSYGGAA